MSALDQLNQSMGPLKERIRREQQMPSEIEELKSKVVELQNAFLAIVEVLTDEQRMKIKEKLIDRSES